MLRMIGRKLILMLILIPLLNAVGFFYAITIVQDRSRRVTEFSPLTAYTDYLSGVFSGDLGLVGRVPVAQILQDRLAASLILLGIAITLTAVVGILLGSAIVSRQTRRMRPWGLLLTTAGSSLPGFLLGGVVISIVVYETLYGIRSDLGQRLTLIPLSGYGLDSHLILPLIVLATRPVLHIAKITGSLLEDELQKNYIQVAYSKGLRQRAIYWRHAFKNIIAAVSTTIGHSMRYLIGGLLIAEMMFLWPGVGQMFVFTLGQRLGVQSQWQYYGNPPLMAALFVVLGVLLLAADLLASSAAYASDPRLGSRDAA